MTDETRRLCTKREHNKALKAWKCLHATGHPNPQDLAKMIQTNQIANCPVTAQDFKVAAHMLGPDTSTLKEKNTWWRPTPVIPKIVELPPELSFCKNVMLALDNVRANQMPFLMTISLKLQHAHVNVSFQKAQRKILSLLQWTRHCNGATREDFK